MPALNPAPTELTTAATDLLLAIECLIVALMLKPGTRAEQFRAVLWVWILALMAAAALLGTIVHLFAWSEAVLDGLWMPLYLGLGITVSLFLVGAINDWRGKRLAARLMPLAVVVGTGFFLVTKLGDDAFVLFVIYEGVVMLGALWIYVLLALRRTLPGAGLIALAIGLSIIAAAIQASDLAVSLLVPFDHNGLFHLVQVLAVAVLGLGLRRGFGSLATV